MKKTQETLKNNNNNNNNGHNNDITSSRIWDTGTGQCLRTLVHEDNPPISSVCFSPNGRYVLASSLDDSLRLWDYVAGTVRRTYQGHASRKFAVGACFCTTGTASARRLLPPAYLVDYDDDEDDDDEDDDDDDDDPRRAAHTTTTSSYVLSGSEDGDVVIWDVKTKDVVQRIERVHKGICFWVDVRKSTMVTVGQDAVVRVFRDLNAPPVAAAAADEEEKEERVRANEVVAGNHHVADGNEHVNAVGVDISEPQPTRPPSLAGAVVKMEDA